LEREYLKNTIPRIIIFSVKSFPQEMAETGGHRHFVFWKRKSVVRRERSKNTVSTKVDYK